MYLQALKLSGSVLYVLCKFTHSGHPSLHDAHTCHAKDERTFSFGLCGMWNNTRREHLERSITGKYACLPSSLIAICNIIHPATYDPRFTNTTKLTPQGTCHFFNTNRLPSPHNNSKFVAALWPSSASGGWISTSSWTGIPGAIEG